MSQLSYTEALRLALSEAMESDSCVILLGEDIGVYGGAFGVTRGLLERFGERRVLDTPISESSFVGAAIGAAIAGSRPVVEIMFMDFLTLAVDQMLNQAAKLSYVFGEQVRCPLVLRTPAGGGRGYGPTHSQNLEAIFLHMPGIQIAAPSTPEDAYQLLKTAICTDNPVLFVEHKRLYNLKGEVNTASASPLPFGQAAIRREGEDLTIVAWSYMVTEAMAAAQQLATDHGISAEVIDLRTLNPLDKVTLTESVKRTGRLLVVEEGCRTGGVAAELACIVFENAFEYLDAPISRVTTPDIPIPASAPLEKLALPDAEKIVRAALRLFDQDD